MFRDSFVRVDESFMSFVVTLDGLSTTLVFVWQESIACRAGKFIGLDVISTAMLDELDRRELERVETVPSEGSDRQKKEGGGRWRGREKYAVFSFVFASFSRLLVPTTVNSFIIECSAPKIPALHAN